MEDRCATLVSDYAADLIKTEWCRARRWQGRKTLA
jgi:hypothetical protein